MQRAQVSVPEGAAQPAQHLTFAVLLNSRQSCSSSLSFLEAITGLGTAKTRYSPASACGSTLESSQVGRGENLPRCTLAVTMFGPRVRTNKSVW